MVDDNTTRVLVVDDECLTAEMTSQYLQRELHFDAMYASSFQQAWELVNSERGFDVVLLDLDIAGMNGLQGVERMVSAVKPGAVVVFTGYARPEGAVKALEVGVRGIIPKNLPLRSLGNAIRFVSFGEIYLPPSFASGNGSQSRKRNAGQLSQLEIEIVRAICKGHTNKDIARDMGMTEVTTKMHVRSISAKLSVKNRTQIAMTAVSNGML